MKAEIEEVVGDAVTRPRSAQPAAAKPPISAAVVQPEAFASVSTATISLPRIETRSLASMTVGCVAELGGSFV